MSWIDDVAADEPIESAWGNLIRDRTVTPFANAAERDTSIPTPDAGQVCYLTDLNRLQVYTGTVWTSPGAQGTLFYGDLGVDTDVLRSTAEQAFVAGLASVPVTLASQRRIGYEAQALVFAQTGTARVIATVRGGQTSAATTTSPVLAYDREECEGLVSGGRLLKASNVRIYPAGTYYFGAYTTASAALTHAGATLRCFLHIHDLGPA